MAFRGGLSRFLTGGLVAPLIDGVVEVVKVRGITEQVLAYCSVLKELAAGTWRPFIARTLGVSIILFVLGSFLLFIYLITMSGDTFAAKEDQIKLMKDMWENLLWTVTYLAGGFLGLTGYQRHKEKLAGVEPQTRNDAILGLERLSDTQIRKIPMDELGTSIGYRRLDGVTVPEQHRPVNATKKRRMTIANDPEQDINMPILYAELERDEGKVFSIYEDQLGNKTFGIGHLVKEGDPEWNQPAGTPVTESRVEEAFVRDVEIAIDDAKLLLLNFADHPRVVKHAIINMAFQLGHERLSQFNRTSLPLVINFAYNKAADTMMQSKWASQTTKRATRVTDGIRSGAEILPLYPQPTNIKA